MKLIYSLLVCTFLISTNVVGQKFKFKEKNGKIGFFIGKKIVVDYQFDAIEESSPGNYVVSKDGLKGYVGEEGKVIIACNYDDLKECLVEGSNTTKFIVTKNGKSGVVGTKSEEILPIVYESIANVTATSVFLRHDDVWKELDIKTMEFRNSNVIFNVAENMPLYGDCYDKHENYETQKECSNSEMLQFIFNEVKYPQSALEQKIEGTIVIRMIINKNGDIEEPKIVRDVGGGLGEEGLRVVRLMPKWFPAVQNGYKSSVYYNLPIKFRLK